MQRTLLVNIITNSTQRVVCRCLLVFGKPFQRISLLRCPRTVIASTFSIPTDSVYGLIHCSNVKVASMQAIVGMYVRVKCSTRVQKASKSMDLAELACLRINANMQRLIRTLSSWGTRTILRFGMQSVGTTSARAWIYPRSLRADTQTCA